MNSVMVSSVLMNSLFKTSFKFTSFTRNSVNFGNHMSYIFKIRISSIIKLIKQKKDLQIDLNVDPEKPFDINLENIQVKDSLDQMQNIHLKNYFKVLRETNLDSWVLQMIEIFIQTSLDYIHERTQMMQTDDTSYYKHEIGKLMTIDEQTLKSHSELDSVVKQKYFRIMDMYLPINPHYQQRHAQSYNIPQSTVRSMANPQKYQINTPNQINPNLQPNQLPPRSQSGSQHPQNLPQMYIQYQQNTIQQPLQLQPNPSQLNLQNKNILQIPQNSQFPIQNNVQPQPHLIHGVIPGQDQTIRQRQSSITSQSGSMGQITPTGQNTQISRTFHQQPAGIIQNPQGIIPASNQNVQQLPIHQQYGQIRPQNPVQVNNHQQIPAIIPQNSQPQPSIPGQINQQYITGHQMVQPPLLQPHLHQQHSLPAHPSIQQPPIGGQQQPILNSVHPPSNIQPQFDPNIGPNSYGQNPQVIQNLVPRSNHPIAPKNY